MAFLLGPLFSIVSPLPLPPFTFNLTDHFQGTKAAQAGISAAQKSKEDQAYRNGWTQQELSTLGSQNPGKNVMIVYPNHTANFQGSQQSTVICTVPSTSDSINYTCYVFDSGDFELQGDGGEYY